jgi:hypothetical protein
MVNHIFQSGGEELGVPTEDPIDGDRGTAADT